MRAQGCVAIVLLALVAVALSATGAATMQAVVVSHAQVHVQTLARPAPAAGQVLINMRFASVNPADWKRAMGRAENAGNDAALSAPPLSWVPGFDGSGVIVALGAAVSAYKVGDAVLVWAPSGGSYAQYLAAPTSNIALKPKSLSFEQAAGLAHAGLAAWNLLHDLAKVHAGQSVLVIGAAGGVGSAAVQIAKNQGARVIATASASHLTYLKALGVDQFIDYGAQHFEAQLRDVDVALNTVDIDNATRALAVVRRGGWLLSVAGLPAQDQCAMRGVACAQVHINLPVAGLQQLCAWSEQGRFKVNVEHAYALSEVLQAWQYSQLGHSQGKSVIALGD